MKLFFNVNKRKRVRGRHRKKRVGFLHHAQEWLWPSIGFRALLRFYELQLKRSAGSAHSVALGFAGGVLVSFTPFIGFHLFLAAAFAWGFRASLVSAVIGTLVGNPWTFPFIWLWVYKLGHFILGTYKPLPFPKEFSLSVIWENLHFYLTEFIWPMFVGGLPTGIVAAVFCYFVMEFHIKSYRMARAAYLLKRRELQKKKRAETAKQLAANIASKIVETVKKDPKQKFDENND